MSEMVERVAKAAREAYNEMTVYGPEWEDAKPGVRDAWRTTARAAIEAMRELTDEMEEAYDGIAIANDGPPAQFSTYAWGKAIDEALK